MDVKTTLAIDNDILDRARLIADRRRSPFQHVVKEALRAGLAAMEEPPRSRPYRTLPRKMGLKAGKSLDNIQELIVQIEGEVHR